MSRPEYAYIDVRCRLGHSDVVDHVGTLCGHLGLVAETALFRGGYSGGLTLQVPPDTPAIGMPVPGGPTVQKYVRTDEMRDDGARVFVVGPVPCDAIC